MNSSQHNKTVISKSGVVLDMKICTKCGFRNLKLVKNKKKEFVCSECGEKLYSGSIKPHGHELKGQGTGNYHMGKIIDSDDQWED